MEFIESIRAKVIWTLVGGLTFLISSPILILKMIVWYLIVFYFLLEIYLNLFYICYWANLASHKGALACYPSTLLLIYFLELYELVCH